MKNNITTRKEIFKFARDKFGTAPEYLWTRTPNFAVLRCSNNQKWYAIIMDLSRRVIGQDSDEIVDVMNVKCDSVLIGMLVGTPGYIPAYHMNKSNWISIILDGSVRQDEIFALITQSHKLASGK